MPEEAKAYDGGLVNDVRAVAQKATRLTAQTVAKEKAAIDHELSVLYNALEDAHSLLSQLESAVSPVSTPTPESDGSAPSHEYVGSSSVYERIHSAATAVHMFQDRVARVVRNLEV